MITLYIKPLSLNSAYPTNGQGRRFLTMEGKKYKAEFASAAVKEWQEMVNWKSPLAFSVLIAGPIYTKAGDIHHQSPDLDNVNKLIIDGVCSGLNINDKLVVKILNEKAYCPNWFIRVNMGPAAINKYPFPPLEYE